MGKLETFALILLVLTLVLIPILILGDNMKSKTEGNATDQNNNDVNSLSEIKDVNMAQEMQKAIDNLELKGVDTSELKNLKTEYAAYNKEEELALIEDDFESVLKYRTQKEEIILLFADILQQNSYFSFNIYEYTKNIKYGQEGNISYFNK
ncbi:MAG: hypothetical protein AMQ74_00554 [Candidatus Methanofastidiosum methylothiophilum]|uniref:Uncharacterized protein n=1 Tax=Candidatus Methanofastidiosum methylothiophilum TaxID=1705564 RepID=A0A150J6U7_9EURY|nr:MAG: hypothetical protein AMQ74_00554 [Candidatus Methanofastidiosum methylthiophilus]